MNELIASSPSLKKKMFFKKIQFFAPKKSRFIVSFLKKQIYIYILLHCQTLVSSQKPFYKKRKSFSFFKYPNATSITLKSTHTVKTDQLVAT
jgi:hypothetical protein